MAITLLPGDKRGQGFQDLFSGLGQGIGSGIEALADSKIKQYQQKKNQEALQSLLPNNSPQEIQGLLNAPKEFQPIAFKQFLSQPQNAAYAEAVNQIINNGPENQEFNAKGLNEKQFTELSKFKQKQNLIQTNQQNKLNSRYQPQVNEIIKKAETSENRLKGAVEAKNLLNSGKFFTGPIAGSTSKLFSDYIKANPSLEEYDRLLNKYIVESLGDLSGQSTTYKAKLIENTKTKVTKSKQAQEAFWSKVIDEQNSNLHRSYALEDMLSENNGNIPKDYSAQLNKRLQEYNSIPKDIEPANNFDEGSVVEENGRLFMVRNGHWSPLGKKE